VKLTAEEKLSTAKAYLMLKHPFYASIVLRLKLQEVDNCPTMFTDGKMLGYNAKFVSKLPKMELVAVLAHEAEHVLFLHFARMANRDIQLWNMAGDYAINGHLMDNGFNLPNDCLFEYQYKNWNTEKIYDELESSAIKIPFCNIGEVRQPKNDDGSNMTPSQIKQLEAEVKVAVEQAAQIAKKQGNLPGHLERLVKELLEPVVNWKEALQEFATKLSKNDYTWTKRNKRYTDVYLPRLETPEIGDLVIAIDTSGSLDDKQLGEIASEVRSIMSIFTVRLTVIYCDAEVQKVEEFENADDFGLKMYGGGGTDYAPVFKEVIDRGIEPVGLLYFTDGYCWSFPRNVPDYKVMWIQTYKYDGFKPKFGEVVVMRNN
jgi:predicted metal-dependent peptidase